MTTANTFRTTQEFDRDAADIRALNAYVAALPEADRVAYYYENREYMSNGFPAYLLHEATMLEQAGDVAAGQKLLSDYWLAQADARFKAQCARNAPVLGDRIANSVVQAAGVGMFTTFGVLGAGAMGLHVAASGILAAGATFSIIAAIGGFITGGK